MSAAFLCADTNTIWARRQVTPTRAPAHNPQQSLPVVVIDLTHPYALSHDDSVTVTNAGHFLQIAWHYRANVG
nr:hypothetical protein [Streptomyces phaeochromogenes]